MKPEDEKIGGLNVPEVPPVPAGLYCPYEFWLFGTAETELFSVDLLHRWPGMTTSAFNSARNNHVFTSKEVRPARRVLVGNCSGERLAEVANQIHRAS